MVEALNWRGSGEELEGKLGIKTALNFVILKFTTSGLHPLHGQATSGDSHHEGVEGTRRQEARPRCRVAGHGHTRQLPDWSRRVRQGNKILASIEWGPFLAHCMDQKEVDVRLRLMSVYSHACIVHHLPLSLLVYVLRITLESFPLPGGAG